jgi:hypothetical protein
MGRFLNFFKKIGGGIKKAFNWVKDKIAPVVQKVLPFVKPIVNMIPGVGPAIGQGINMVEKIAPLADKFVNGSGKDRMDVVKQGIGMMSGGKIM